MKKVKLFSIVLNSNKSTPFISYENAVLNQVMDESIEFPKMTNSVRKSRRTDGKYIFHTHTHHASIQFDTIEVKSKIPFTSKYLHTF